MSKFTLYDWRCTECELKFEDLAKPDIRVMSCPRCEAPAKRLISAPAIRLPGTDPDFPGAYDKWARDNKAKRKEDKAFYDRHGVDKKHHSYGS